MHTKGPGSPRKNDKEIELEYYVFRKTSDLEKKTIFDE